MAFANETFWADAVPYRFKFPFLRSDRVVPAVAALGVGTALALWSVATLETLHRVEGSLLGASAVFPESVLGSGAVALANPTRQIIPLAGHWAAAFGGNGRLDKPVPSSSRTAADQERAASRSSYARLLRPTKSARLPTTAAAAKADKPMAAPVEERFGPATAKSASLAGKRGSLFLRARLAAVGAGKSPALASVAPSPAEFVTAFASAESAASATNAAFGKLLAPASARFGTDAGSRAGGHDPVAERFGPAVVDTSRASRLALALVEALPSGSPDAATVPVPSAPPVQVASLEPEQSPRETVNDATPLAEAIPDNVPVPSRRPQWTMRSPVAKPDEQAEPAQRPRQEQQPRHQEETPLAYAAPDGSTIRTRGGEVENRFSVPSPTPPSGVAIYDIKAATVYMPNGDRLEAHSGLGHMADEPRYVDEKNRGPTPPNTYRLVMRESRFHGVEAIRLIPVDGNNKYGRNGLLAHTYMLRGGLAQSNGCVVFKNYQKFLKAFKRGRITRLVVVPSRSAMHSTTMASADHGA
jgi:hypothetical protein